MPFHTKKERAKRKIKLVKKRIKKVKRGKK